MKEKTHLITEGLLPGSIDPKSGALLHMLLHDVTTDEQNELGRWTNQIPCMYTGNDIESLFIVY